jgi:hypothetical protein
VNQNGDVNLLREVTVMQKRIDNQNARKYLITDASLLPNYEGVVRRDGKLVGIRMSTAFYDFPVHVNQLGMTGSVAAGGSVTGTISLDADHPTNPFRHMYHPDHKTGRTITRDISLTFNPKDSNKPESGVFTLTGAYKEEITGVHKNKITVEGSFTMNRVSGIADLNE